MTEELNFHYGCYYCFQRFDRADILRWTDDGRTPICPFCSIDNVIGNDIEFINLEELVQRHNEAHRSYKRGPRKNRRKLTTSDAERIRPIPLRYRLLERRMHNNRDDLERYGRCGCYVCRRFYTPDDIEGRDWPEDNDAICPTCRSASLLVDTPDNPVTPELLEELHADLEERRKVWVGKGGLAPWLNE